MEYLNLAILVLHQVIGIVMTFLAMGTAAMYYMIFITAATYLLFAIDTKIKGMDK